MIIATIIFQVLTVCALVGTIYWQRKLAQEPVSYTHLTLPTNREV